MEEEDRGVMARCSDKLTIGGYGLASTPCCDIISLYEMDSNHRGMVSVCLFLSTRRTNSHTYI